MELKQISFIRSMDNDTHDDIFSTLFILLTSCYKTPTQADETIYITGDLLRAA